MTRTTTVSSVLPAIRRARGRTRMLVEDEVGDPPSTPLIDRELLWDDRWLAAALPARYAIGDGGELAVRQPRYLSDGGRLFFDSVDALVPGAKDVTAPYEYEPTANGESEADGGHDTCATASSAYAAPAEGCLDLLTKGQSGEESMFLDASENGNDVFVLTSEKLAESDIDRAYDVYDAHVCGSGWECPSSPVVSPPCITTESCRGAPASQPAIYGSPSSATYSGAGNAPSVTPTITGPPKTTKKKVAVKCAKGKHRSRGKCVRTRPKKKKQGEAGHERPEGEPMRTLKFSHATPLMSIGALLAGFAFVASSASAASVQAWWHVQQVATPTHISKAREAGESAVDCAFERRWGYGV